MTFGAWPFGRSGGGGGGGAPAKVPTLQPTLFSPWAQWAMDTTVLAGVFPHDRSGNGRDLGVNYAPVRRVRSANLPDPARAWFFAGVQQFLFDASQVGYVGDLTVTFPLIRAQSGSEQGETWWINTSPGAFNQCIAGFTSSNKFLYVADPSGGVVSVMDAPAPGELAFISVRRPAAGGVTWGKNLTFETASIGPPLSAGGTFQMGGPDFGGGTHFFASGTMNDVCVWHSILTDGQIATLYHAAMGV